MNAIFARAATALPSIRFQHLEHEARAALQILESLRPNPLHNACRAATRPQGGGEARAEFAGMDVAQEGTHWH